MHTAAGVRPVACVGRIERLLFCCFQAFQVFTDLNFPVPCAETKNAAVRGESPITRMTLFGKNDAFISMLILMLKSSFNLPAPNLYPCQ